MERLPPDAPNPNAFSDMVDRLCKEHNDGHPQWQVAGGDVRPARFEYLDEKVASCGLTARRNHGTQTGPENGAPANESCRGMYAAGANKSAFWKAHIQHPQLPEYCDFYESVGHSAPVPIDIEDLQNLEKIGVYAGFQIPSQNTFRRIALVMGSHFREFCRTPRLCKPALKCMAELDAVNPQKYRNYFRSIL